MKLLRVVPIEDDGSCYEKVNHVCYHPVQISKLLEGENVKPCCCAVDYEPEDNDRITKLINKIDEVLDEENMQQL